MQSTKKNLSDTKISLTMAADADMLSKVKEHVLKDLAKDLKLPEGSTLAIDEEALIVNFTAAPTAEDLEAELAEAEAEAGIEPTVADVDEDEEPATEPEPEPANA